MLISRFTQRTIEAVTLVLLVMLAIVLNSCGAATDTASVSSASTATVLPAAIATKTKGPASVTPTTAMLNSALITTTTTNHANTTAPASIISTPLLPTNTPIAVSSPTTSAMDHCGIAVDYAPQFLSQEITESSAIFLGTVTNIGALVWNTADGKEPTMCKSGYEQYAPVEITIKESYKGSQTAGTKVTVLLPGAPDSKPYGNYTFFPKLGEQNLRFLDNDYNYRRDNSANPLMSPSSQIYTLHTGDKWQSVHGEYTLGGKNDSFTTAELKKAIADPASYPMPPTSTPLPPSPTPLVKVGQSVNLVKLYGLDKTTSVYLESFKMPTVTTFGPNDPRFKNLIADLDKNLTLLSTPTLLLTGNNWVVIGFTFADSQNIAFTYDYKADTLGAYLPDKVNQISVPAPLDLLQILGLNP